MDFQEIIAGSVGKENTFGTVVGSLKAGPLTYCRVSTDDLQRQAARLRAARARSPPTSSRPSAATAW